jgi:hypothetical protein
VRRAVQADRGRAQGKEGGGRGGAGGRGHVKVLTSMFGVRQFLVILFLTTSFKENKS